MITLDKTKDLEDQLGWTKEELKAVLVKLYDKAKEIVNRYDNHTVEELQKDNGEEITIEVMDFAASLATTPVQLFFMGIKASIAGDSIGKQIMHDLRTREMKKSLAKMEALGEMLEKMMSSDEKEGTESPSVTPGPAKVD